MRVKDHFLFFLCIITSYACAQNNLDSSLNIGSPAPALHVQEWIKGSPIQQMEKGRIYVVEFWATWCMPCIAAMPHISALALKHKDKVTVIGIDIYEDEGTSVQKVKAFVNSMGNKMNYHVAIGDDARMVDEWLIASGEKEYGIPRTFVVNAEGQLAWMGHPKDLDTVLQKLVDNDWDIKEALAKRDEQKRLKLVEEDAAIVLGQYSYDKFDSDVDRAEATLLAIPEIVRDEPELQYSYSIIFYTFSSLLKINQREAYEYGQKILLSTFRNPRHSAIIDAIRWEEDELSLAPEIYQLRAEAYQQKIDHLVYPEIADVSGDYSQMAAWYWRAGDKSQAIVAQKKAIEALKSKKKFSASDLAALESQLQQYKEMRIIK